MADSKKNTKLNMEKRQIPTSDITQVCVGEGAFKKAFSSWNSACYSGGEEYNWAFDALNNNNPSYPIEDKSKWDNVIRLYNLVRREYKEAKGIDIEYVCKYIGGDDEFEWKDYWRECKK